MSYEQALDEVARKQENKRGQPFKNWGELTDYYADEIGDLYGISIYMKEASELYARSKWEEACEAQRIICADRATCENIGDYDGSGEACDYYQVDKDSILNAPKPEFKP
jgi:hypothetical protein